MCVDIKPRAVGNMQFLLSTLKHYLANRHLEWTNILVSDSYLGLFLIFKSYLFF